MLKCDQGFKDKATTTSVGRHWDGLTKTRAGLIKIIVIMAYFDCVSKDVTSEKKKRKKKRAATCFSMKISAASNDCKSAFSFNDNKKTGQMSLARDLLSSRQDFY